MTDYARQEQRLSRLFFGQGGKDCEEMSRDFAVLARMHRNDPWEISQARAEAAEIVSDLLHRAANLDTSAELRRALLDAAIAIVITYDETWPGAVSRLRAPLRTRGNTGPHRLSNAMMSVLTSVRAGLVSYVRSGDGLRCERGGGVDVTTEVEALLGLGLVSIAQLAQGFVAITDEGEQELR